MRFSKYNSKTEMQRVSIRYRDSNSTRTKTNLTHKRVTIVFRILSVKLPQIHIQKMILHTSGDFCIYFKRFGT